MRGVGWNTINDYHLSIPPLQACNLLHPAMGIAHSWSIIPGWIHELWRQEDRFWGKWFSTFFLETIWIQLECL